MDSESSGLSDFEKSVFINCPFDKAYFPLLKAMVWVLVQGGLNPRLALERGNAGEGRLAKIRELIEASKYGIYDLSRLQAAEKDEFYRLNMPFELGLDYACRLYSPRDEHSGKVFLVLEGSKHTAHKALSDIGFTDVHAHEGKAERLVGVVRDWLADNGRPLELSASGLWRAYNESPFEFGSTGCERRILASSSLRFLNDAPASICKSRLDLTKIRYPLAQSAKLEWALNSVEG